jgi:hypothetical protein
MAKYRISSIPQSLPKNQRGGLFKKKKEKQNSIINYTPPSEETMVQGIEPQNNLGYNFNAPALPTAESFPTYDIGAQDYGRERTAEEVANTFSQPFMWSQGETQPAYDYTYNFRNPLRNPATENSYQYSLQSKLGLPYTGNPIEQRTIHMPEKFFPDYFAPVTETGEPLTCTDGKIAYKGQCITEEAYAIIAQRELDQEDFQFQKDQEERNKKFELEMAEIRKQNEEQSDRLYKYGVDAYFDRFNKAKKSDKIDPYESVYTSDLQYMVPVKDQNGEPMFDEKTGEPLMETAEEKLKRNGFFVHRTENGYSELYPIKVMKDRIWNNGFQADQFKNYWGLDPKQVKEQLGDLMNTSKSVYDETMYYNILNKALEEGVSPNEAAGMFSTKLGYADAFRKDYVPKVQADMDKAYEQFIDETLKDLRKEIGVKEDNKGWVTNDNSKKDDKQNVNFDFYNNFYKDAYDESGKLTSREFDPIGQYAQKWIDSAPTQKEKIARQKKVNAIKNKDYSAVGKKAYDESLNAPGSGYLGDPFEGLSNQQITNTYGDRMQTLRSNQYKEFNDRATGNAIDASNQAIKTKMEADLAEATGFNKDFKTFMGNRNKQNIYTTYRTALKDENINEADKAQILAALKKNGPQGALDLVMNREAVNSSDSDNSFFKPTYNDQLSSIGSIGQYYNMVTGDRVTAGKPAQEIGIGTKIWDVVTNPGDALYYAMNGRGESMWDNWNVSYNDRKEAERRFGTDLGTYKDVNPMSMVLDIANTVSPFNWGDEMARGYQANGLQGLSQRGSDLTWDAAATAAMFIPGGQGFKLGRQAVNLAKSAEALNAVKNTGTLLSRTANTGQRLLNSTMKAFNTFERGLNASGMPGKYFVNYGRTMFPALAVDALRPYGDFDTGLNNLYDGNVSEGLGQIAKGTIGTIPYISRGVESYNMLRGLENPGTVGVYPNLNSRYSLSYNAATPGSGLMYGNPNAMNPNIGQPRFQSITNPINKLSGRLGYGQFNINRINPGTGLPVPTQTTNLLGYQRGGVSNGLIDSLRQLGKKQYGGPSSGLATELSDSEIEMYVKGGYIIEDE